MRKAISAFIIVSFALLAPRASFAAGEPGELMFWGAGGRAMGMGNTGVGIANDAFAAYWNPGALGALESKEIGTFHSILWEDTSFSFLSYIHPTLNKGVYGFSFTRLSSVGADKRDENNVSVGGFGDSQMVIGFSWGKNLYRNVFWGMSAKYFSHTIDTFNQNAFTTDTGIYLPVNDNLTLGANVQNVISRMLSETDDQLPLVFRTGAGYKLLNNKLLLALDLTHQSKNAFIDNYGVGVEYTINKMFKGRLGKNKEEMTAGFGVEWNRLRFDYAMAMHYLGSSHRVSFNVRFGQTLSQMRQAGQGEEEAGGEEGNAELEMSQERFREVFQNAITLYRRGLYKQSFEKFKSAQEMDPKDLDVPLYLDRIGLLEPIVPQVISSDKTSELLRRGITYFIEGDGKSAVKTIAYSLSTEPDNFTISRVLGRVEEKTGFKADYAKPVSGMSTVDQKLYEALIAFRKKDYSYVITQCEDVLILEPKNTLALKRLGSAFFALGEKEKAMDTWKKAIEIEPDAKLEELMNKIKNQTPQNKK